MQDGYTYITFFLQRNVKISNVSIGRLASILMAPVQHDYV